MWACSPVVDSVGHCGLGGDSGSVGVGDPVGGSFVLVSRMVVSSSCVSGGAVALGWVVLKWVTGIAGGRAGHRFRLLGRVMDGVPRCPPGRVVSVLARPLFVLQLLYLFLITV